MKLAIVVAFTVAAGSAYGQVLCGGAGFGTGSSSGPSEATFRYSAPIPQIVRTVTGAPYSGQSTTQSVQTGANGLRLNQPSISAPPMMYRDSAGRTRTDARMGPVGLPGTQRPQSLAQIDDVVAGYRIILDPVHQIAHRIAYCTPQPPAGRGAAGGSGRIGTGVVLPIQIGAANVQVEQLGTQTISGVTVTGQRRTSTFPPGTYQGNNIEVVTVEETWTSPQYGVLLSKNTGPMSEMTMTMANFSTAEPDPALFKVPAGWQVVDETAPFTITITYGN